MKLKKQKIIVWVAVLIVVVSVVAAGLFLNGADDPYEIRDIIEIEGWVDMSANINVVSSNGAKTIYTDVYFINDNEGWVTSTSNEIYHTQDGGQTWEVQTGLQCYAEAIHMIDTNVGYAGGEDGNVYKTTDGTTWEFVGSMDSTLVDISFPPGTDSNNPVGYACGNNGQLWKISSSLTNLNIGLQGSISGVSAPSPSEVWFCASNRVFYHNGTELFTTQSSTTRTFNDIHFVNNQEGWVVGTDGLIAHTSDGGATPWINQTSPVEKSLHGVFFLDSNEGWTVGSQGLILYTATGGTSWTVISDNQLNFTLLALHATGPNSVYVCGTKGTLLKYVGT